VDFDPVTEWSLPLRRINCARSGHRSPRVSDAGVVDPGAQLLGGINRFKIVP
jgi:hypothetical protein